MKNQEPSYLQLSSSELRERAAKIKELASPCCLCPWSCMAKREEGELGHCQAPSRAVVASVHPHFGEEPELVGLFGSGTIFFGHCNLDCIFCQNWELSQENEGREVEPEELAKYMVKLQERGCHNINFVTPTPHLAAIMEALPHAVKNGLQSPLVYNCGGYEAPDIIKLLEGIFDIYMPDFKYADNETARLYSGPTDYADQSRAALKEMHRQVGDLKTDKNKIAYRGLLVRHLVLPENLAGTEEAVRFLVEEISPHTAVNVMRQYRPAYKAYDYPPLNRPLRSSEYSEARKIAEEAGLRILK